jgi:hypothetical protein
MQIDDLIKYILPEDIVTYFEPVDIKELTGQLTIYLDERNILPPELEGKPVVSKGFQPPVLLEDFPIRYRKVVLSVRKRKWVDKSDGKVYSRNWELKAKGTSYTKEFGTFLKGIVG